MLVTELPCGQLNLPFRISVFEIFCLALNFSKSFEKDKNPRWPSRIVKASQLIATPIFLKPKVLKNELVKNRVVLGRFFCQQRQPTIKRKCHVSHWSWWILRLKDQRNTILVLIITYNGSLIPIFSKHHISIDFRNARTTYDIVSNEICHNNPTN